MKRRYETPAIHVKEIKTETILATSDKLDIKTGPTAPTISDGFVIQSTGGFLWDEDPWE